MPLSRSESTSSGCCSTSSELSTLSTPGSPVVRKRRQQFVLRTPSLQAQVELRIQIGDREPAAERVSIAEEQSEKAAGSKQGSPDFNSNSKREENKMDEQQLHDDSAPTSLVEIPSVDMPSVPDSIELDKLSELAGGDDVQVESAEEKVKETEKTEEEETAGDVEDEESAPVSSVRSTDRESNNGDYVQVSAEDAPVDEQPHVEHPVVPTPPSSPVPVEEEKKEKEQEKEQEQEAEPEVAVEAKESSVPAEPSPVPETTVTPASPVSKEAPVMAEQEKEEEEEKAPAAAPAAVTVPLKKASPKAGLGKYIDDHPEMIKQAAIVGAVVGTVGVAIYAYRHIKAN